MLVETCSECGFNAEEWSTADALSAIEGLPARYRDAVMGVAADDLLRRPVDNQWSIAEYVDHVREVIFGMRFLVGTAITQAGTDLGKSPSSPFQPEPRRVEIDAVLSGLEREATLLQASLSELSPGEWRSTVTFDGIDVDPSWIARHAVHDATHHLLDIERLRGAL